MVGRGPWQGPRGPLATGLLYGGVLVVTGAFLFPLAWMILASFKTQIQNTAIPPLLWFAPTGENYRRIFQTASTVRSTWISLVVASGATALALAVGLPAAYSVARYRQRRLALTILTAKILPGISYLIPWFILFTKVRMVGTYPALILSHLTVTLPLVIWIMIGFFEDVPSELSDAAQIDGCSIYGTFLRVALPLTVPGIVSAGILAFIFSWNNFMFSLILGGSDLRTLPVAVYDFISYTQIDWGGLNATATVVTLPVLIMALILQKGIHRGLVIGGVKG